MDEKQWDYLARTVVGAESSFHQTRLGSMKIKNEESTRSWHELPQSPHKYLDGLDLPLWLYREAPSSRDGITMIASQVPVSDDTSEEVFS